MYGVFLLVQFLFSKHTMFCLTPSFIQANLYGPQTQEAFPTLINYINLDNVDTGIQQRLVQKCCGHQYFILFYSFPPFALNKLGWLMYLLVIVSFKPCMYQIEICYTCNMIFYNCRVILCCFNVNICSFFISTQSISNIKYIYMYTTYYVYPYMYICTKEHVNAIK